MAKAPDDRYPTCTALITAAEEALELRRPPARLRRRRLVVAPGDSSSSSRRGPRSRSAHSRDGRRRRGRADRHGRHARPHRPCDEQGRWGRHVGQRPSAVAVGGRSVWVYNAADPSVSEIDPATDTVRHTTSVIAAPTRLDAFSGPVLAADAGGAWLVGTDARGRSYLTRVCRGLAGSASTGSLASRVRSRSDTATSG